MRFPLLVATLLLAFSLSAFAQAPAAPAPPKIWTVEASAGLAVTSGNTDTSTVTAAYDVTYDPKTRNLVKSDGLWIRAKTEGVLSTDKLGLNIRDEYKLNGKAFVFAQNIYLHDEFKSIDYLLAPGGGLGYRVFDTMQTKLTVDAGAGGVWEKNPGFDVRSSGAVTAGEKLTQAITGNTTLTQSVAALWKTKDWSDTLFTFRVGVAAAMSTRTQLKAELLDSYKNKPPLVTVQKNDVAVLMAFVYKM
jgi:putative salt-induced outer membrane protein YdiY